MTSGRLATRLGSMVQSVSTASSSSQRIPPRSSPSAVSPRAARPSTARSGRRRRPVPAHVPVPVLASATTLPAAANQNAVEMTECPQCKKRFRLEEIWVHIKDVHPVLIEEPAELARCPECNKCFPLVEIREHISAIHPHMNASDAVAPLELHAANQQQEQECPICLQLVKMSRINAHLDSECTGPPRAPSPLSVSRRSDSTTSTRVTRKRVRDRGQIESLNPHQGKESQEFGLIDGKKRARRQEMETSRQSMFSRAQMKDTAQTQLVADTDRFDFLLNSMVDDCVDHSLLDTMRLFAFQHVKLPPEAFDTVFKWIGSESISLRDSLYCFTCVREVLAAHSSQWIPLNLDWHRFMALMSVLADPFSFVARFDAHYLKKPSQSQADCSDVESLDGAIVSSNEMLQKKMMMLKLFVGAFGSDILSRKRESTDLCAQGLLRALVTFAARENGDSMDSIVCALSNSCTMAQFAAQCSQERESSIEPWQLIEIGGIAEHLQRILNDCFPDTDFQ